MNFPASRNRIFKLIRDNISNLDLDLRGLTVLTEAGSGHYLYTPIIPLLAGADKVIAFVKDSPYGKAEHIREQCLAIANGMQIDERLDIYTGSLPAHVIKAADIITNSAMLRPLDEQKLKHTKKGVVIPLMFEAWEMREGDIDIEFCRKNNIAVGGTWEQHPAVRVFEYVGALAMKMALEAGYAVLQNNIAVWSDDEFGNVITDTFYKNGATSCILTTDVQLLKQHIKQLDFIFIADYSEEGDYTEDAAFNINELSALNPGLTFIHLYGKIELDNIPEAYRNNIYPLQNGKAKIMSRTLAYVGIDPLIKLLTAGLKTGEELYYNKLSELTQRL